MKSTPIGRIKKHFKAHTKKDIFLVFATILCLVVGSGLFWISSFRLPDLSSFEQRKVTESTKVYDRTGKVLLHDFHDSVKRTIVPSAEISAHIKNAMVAIEDEDFYKHRGIKITSIFRAILANVMDGDLLGGQGGSTITQQVVKNTLLTQEKKLSRKLKEWVLAIKLDKILPKDTILTVYLNENPYGGSIYGVEEASQQFFSKTAKDVTLAEAAYLAAIPQATTYYSPYGKNLDKLEARKNLVLDRMIKNGYITKEEYDAAKNEKVVFQPQSQYGIKAPHFVFFVRDYLEGILGKGVLDEGGYKIITTLDIDLQEKAEALVKETATYNTENFNATNAALIALDPKTGGILTMVGSRDYFDKEIDGKFNVSTSPNRQPGSTMKPIIYARAFMEGYTPETVVFDLKTEFSSQCTVESKPINPSADPKICYSPQNYDEIFRGPITLRNALAQSINVPAIKTLYLTGIKDSLALAKDMGITSLKNPDTYGLTLVLGGGEVSLLEMSSAYGTFANEGVRVPYRPVVQIFDAAGNEIKLPEQKQSRVLSENAARQISDILSDNVARTPAYGANSVLHISNRDVAVKTGTTNDSRDAWTVGYSPNLVVAVWAGNNDNSPMVKKVAGQIVAPMWSKFMRQALTSVSDERFVPPTSPDPSTLKPILRGVWQGGNTYTIDTVTGKLATSFTPQETRKEIAVNSVHSILYWVDKNNPLGPAPSNPSSDPQFEKWETAVRAWAMANGYADQNTSVIPTQTDDIHTDSALSLNIQGFNSSTVYGLNDTVSLIVGSSGRNPMTRATLYVNDAFVATLTGGPFIFRFNPKDVAGIRENNTFRVVGFDSIYNKGEVTGIFNVALDN